MGAAHITDPQGYKVYSSLHFNSALRLSCTPIFSFENDLAPESREVVFMAGDEDIRLGSIQLLPVNLMLQYHPPCKTDFIQALLFISGVEQEIHTKSLLGWEHQPIQSESKHEFVLLTQVYNEDAKKYRW